MTAQWRTCPPESAANGPCGLASVLSSRHAAGDANDCGYETEGGKSGPAHRSAQDG